jgi:hypothetical protein
MSFSAEFLQEITERRRIEILDTLIQKLVDNEVDLKQIVKKKDYDQTVLYFQNNYGLSLDNSTILADAIGKEVSGPQGNFFSST